ncbi:hypothetical protein ACLOJK_009751 [Asimina triloba]
MGKAPSSSIPSKLGPPLLPPSPSPTKKTLILDLDNTLICTKPYLPENNHYDFQVKYTNEKGMGKTCNVLKRPGVDMLLEKISKLDFEIVAFTAGSKDYASRVLDLIDPNRLISHRLYRDSCKKIGGKYFKDLTDLGRGMDQVVAVDDQPDVYLFESLPASGNVFPVSKFMGKNLVQDGQLQGVVQFLEFVAGYFSDTREAIRQYRAIQKNERTRKRRQHHAIEENERARKQRRCDAVAVNGRRLFHQLPEIAS